jgi:PKHD-type hydroxylase
MAKEMSVEKKATTSKTIKKILISQARPESERSPYFELASKYNVELHFHPLIQLVSIPSKEFRKSKIKWMHHDGQSAWVYDRIRDLSIEANNAIWKFNLHSIIDSIQYTEYYEGGGHYGWHTDIGPGSINHRKISITIQLSDPNEYEGGDLELWSGGDFKTMPKQKGAAVLFPSFLLHRVTPVTKGVRKSLVLWVGGSPYK